MNQCPVHPAIRLQNGELVFSPCKCTSTFWPLDQVVLCLLKHYFEIMLVNCLLKRLEIGNMIKWNVLDPTCIRGEGKNLAKSHNHVSNTMNFTQMTQIFVLNRSTMSATASISMLVTQVLVSWRSDIYLLKISNIKKMTPNMFPHKLL